MPWPIDSLETDQFDASTDSPALARPEMLKTVEAAKEIIAGRGTADGVCELDGNTRVPGARFGRNEADGVAGLNANLKLDPAQLPYTDSHEWDGTRLRLRNLDGSWGDYTDLRAGEPLLLPQPGYDIALGGGDWAGGASDGTTLWFVNNGSDEAVAFAVATRLRDRSKDINLGGGDWVGGASDGTTLWFVNNGSDEAVAFAVATRLRDRSKDINLGGGDWEGGASDGTTLWFVNDGSVNKAVAYVAATRLRDSGKDINLGSGTWRGAFTDGATLWFVNGDTKEAVAYVVATRARDSDEDFQRDSRNTLRGGTFAGATTLWVVVNSNNLAAAYRRVLINFL